MKHKQVALLDLDAGTELSSLCNTLHHNAVAYAKLNGKELLLTDSGKVLQQEGETVVAFPLSVQVDQVSCNGQAALFLTHCGQVLGMGANISGLFGNLGYLHEPTILSVLNDFDVVTVSLGATHAAVVSHSKELFTWGSAKSGQLGRPNASATLPAKVPSVSNVKAAVCQHSFTCVLTWGGFVYIFGTLSDLEDESYCPYQVPDLQKLLVKEIACNDKVIAVLTDEGEIFAFDRCLELVALPAGSTHVIQSLAVADNSVLGYSQEGTLYRWPVISQHDQGLCELTLRPGQEFELNPACEGTSLHQGWVLVNVSEPAEGALASLKNTYMPLARFPHTEELVSSICGGLEAAVSFKLKKERRSKNNTAYPDGFCSDTLQKIVKYREESKQREVLLKAFQPLSTDRLSTAFSCIKARASLNKLYLQTRLPIQTAQLFTRKKEQFLASAWEKLKSSEFLYSQGSSRPERVRRLKAQLKNMRFHTRTLNEDEGDQFRLKALSRSQAGQVLQPVCTKLVLALERCQTSLAARGLALIKFAAQFRKSKPFQSKQKGARKLLLGRSFKNWKQSPFYSADQSSSSKPGVFLNPCYSSPRSKFLSTAVPTDVSFQTKVSSTPRNMHQSLSSTSHRDHTLCRCLRSLLPKKKFIK